jgi:hypothetical protein
MSVLSVYFSWKTPQLEFHLTPNIAIIWEDVVRLRCSCLNPGKQHNWSKNSCRVTFAWFKSMPRHICDRNIFSSRLVWRLTLHDLFSSPFHLSSEQLAFCNQTSWIMKEWSRSVGRTPIKPPIACGGLGALRSRWFKIEYAPKSTRLEGEWY